MPLKITLAPEEKVIINGVVIANSGPAATLSILNQAHILRGKDILTPEEAQTPATRIYYVIQCLYLFPERAEDYAAAAGQFLKDYREAAPSAAGIVDEVLDHLTKGEVYGGLKAVKKLFAHEKEALAHVSDATAASL